MGQVANQRLAVFDLTAADRAIMEFLYANAKLSVPAIASRYQVSRQHVQLTVNRLLERRLVTTRDNPRHRRSPLVELTRSGKALFERIIEQDSRLVEQVFADVSQADRRCTRRTLDTLLKNLSAGQRHVE
jgi:DNA-binding MarR family transcriptional regulator